MKVISGYWEVPVSSSIWNSSKVDMINVMVDMMTTVRLTSAAI